MSQPKILIVEDDDAFRVSLVRMVERLNYGVVEAASVTAAREAVRAEAPDIVILDLDLPDGSGLDLRLDDGVASRTPFIVISGDASTGAARRALELGATDYLTKPVDPEHLRDVLAALLKGQPLRREIDQLEGELRTAGRFGALIGRSGPMQRVYELIARVAPTDAPVLVCGESGSGKEVVAQTLHTRSRRAEAPFIALNCGAMPEALIESELFGHEKGSFTGATGRKSGVFEAANGGTLFLDEIGEMPMDLQVRLLRVLETQKITPVGGSRVVDVDVRVIAATNREPQEAIAKGRLREDLYFRLSVFPIVLPPLRERGDDVRLLADHFLDALNAKHGVTKHFARGVREDVADRPWPGNVRQLRNAIERAWIMTDQEIRAEDLVDAARTMPSAAADPSEAAGAETATFAVAAGSAPTSQAAPTASNVLTIAVGTTIAQAERELIEATLEACEGNKRKAARVLGVSVKTLYNRLNAYAAAEASAEVDTHEDDTHEDDTAEESEAT